MRTEAFIHTPSDWELFITENPEYFNARILLLTGDLGAGKTTFTKEFLKLTEDCEEISSPTYAIVNEYAGRTGKIFHFDLYRLNSPEEAEEIGLYEYLESGNRCIIEWPEICMDELSHYPHTRLHITKEESGRRARIEYIS